MTGNRQSRGNMIFLVSLTIGLVIAIGVGGLIFNRILLERTRAQYSLDALALSMASSINPGDRVGQVNRLEEASRELVFTSRQAVNACSTQEASGFTRLSNMLLNEARSGHALVENERRNQIAVIGKEVQEAVHSYENKRDKRGGLGFLSIRTNDPKIVRVDLGRIKNVDSNIESLDAIPELYEFDRNQGYVDKPSKLFKCDVSVKLPQPDSDLSFSFCALPAYVGKTCSPPRNTNVNAFKSYGSIFVNGVDTLEAFDQIPDALQITSNMDVGMASAAKNSANLATLSTVSTGVCSGASAESQ
ncbi:MAG: hypothetical protein K8F91_13500 [Candidatus Obscuribacterales bacterium]|nr:hypothetical protein [Candidatus Obscuribacterales bacterium]